MASLRARVLVSLLALAAAGLIALAAVTYAEQSSFLQGRVNQEARGAIPALAQALTSSGVGPPREASPLAESSPRGANDGDADNAPPAGGGANAHTPAGGGLPAGSPNLPPGTYGQRRSASGKVLGHKLFSYGQSAPAAPSLPASVPLERLFTVGSVGSSGLKYRVYAVRDKQDSGITIAAVPLTEVDQTLSRLRLVEVLVIVGVLVALGLSAFFVVRLGLRPLDRMQVTAAAIAAGDLSCRVSPATPRTEVGRLGLALNAMLDRLEEAFAERQASEDRLRRFLADASHELRTPLASIRGYAELFRMGATKDEAGTRMAMRRIEDESERMGVLVEDLLTLARLDETPELTHAPVDMVALARDAVDDARATAPDRAIELSAHGHALVSGDAHRLRQVLANLTRNALVHTPAGTPIEVCVEQDERQVTLSVRDHGPGLPPGSGESLFERFWRAEGGRERGRAGAGLGLAIAYAIVDAHGGSISAENATDGGAVFVVHLAKAPPAPQPQATLSVL